MRTHPLWVIDPTSNNTVIKTITIGGSLQGVAAMPGGSVYVTNNVFDTVSVIDPTSNTLVQTITGINNAMGVAAMPGGDVYVTAGSSGMVSIIDPSNNNSVTSGTFPGNVNYVAAMPGGDVYITQETAGTVLAFNPSAGTLTTIPVGGSPLGIAAVQGGDVYVTDQTQGTVSVIDPGSNTVVQTIQLGGSPWGVSAGQGGEAYVTNVTTGTVSVIGVLSAASAPGSLSVTGIGGSGTQATLSWSSPATTGGSAISSYVIQQSLNQGSSWVTSTATVTGTTATVTGLTPGGTYSFRVAAVNSVGTSPWSATAVVTLTLHTRAGLAFTGSLAQTGSSIPDGLIPCAGGALLFGGILVIAEYRKRVKNTRR